MKEWVFTPPRPSEHRLTASPAPAAVLSPELALAAQDNGMSIRHLDKMFRPGSVALIGASDRPRSIGAVVMRNLLEGGFSGPIMPVNPKHRSIAGVLSYPDVDSLPLAPDLAVICTPPAPIPAVVDSLGRRGTRAAVVITAGLDAARLPDGRSVEQAMLEAARPHLLRVLGPNCVGLLVPSIGLNASFAHIPALDGNIAFVSQSGALCTVVLDWANSQGIGFSHFISLGNSADVDFGDVIDYLASDGRTRSILLYIESIKQARKFLSAARAAARNKPIIAVKSGRNPFAAKAAFSHTGALAGGDDVYSAAFSRAGIVRVDGTEELFEAAETLARARRLGGERLAILTNGGGPGVVAVDALIAEGGTLAELSAETMAHLDKALPATWSRGNPVDIVGDASSERYAEALKIVLDDANVDAVLAMHAPTAVMPAIEPARAVIAAAAETKKKILACWLGRDAVAEARRAFAEAGIASFETPHGAVRGFIHLVEYRRAQEVLMETPPAIPRDFAPDTAAARRIVDEALAAGRDVLSEPEAKAVLAAYGVPVVETVTAADVDSAVAAAEQLGFPVALKILSPDIVHKSDVGGVVLDVEGPKALRRAGEAMLARVRQLRPEARLEGFTVQRMARRPRAHELIVGAACDPIFGPVILFGHGGTAVEVVRDRAVALPPLNMGLARELIGRTRVARLLAGFRDQPAADMAAIELVLVQVSQLIADVPEIAELDVNPLYADEKGVVALDARIRLERAAAEGSERLAIRPYPQQLEEEITLLDGRRLTLRPIRPEDEPAHMTFFSKLKPDDIRFRFFGLVRPLAHSEMARFTQIDYDREMAFVATAPGPDGKPETFGVVRAVTDPDNQRAEFAIIVRSDIKGQGLGYKLMKKIIDYCRSRGTAEIVGQVMRENKAMRKLAEDVGFTARSLPEADAIEMTLDLQAAPH
jgi:acetyltransferase